jgi:hypothetical protein
MCRFTSTSAYYKAGTKTKIKQESVQTHKNKAQNKTKTIRDIKMYWGGGQNTKP